MRRLLIPLMILFTAACSADADGDGFNANEDCDDNDEAVNPDAVEVCDGVDNDCDDETDEGVTITVYADVDGDGYGDPDVSFQRCEPEPGEVEDNTDCNDGEKDANPEGTEVCDGLDNDCNGETDEDSATDAPTWYRDADEDDYGTNDDTLVQCDQPDGYVALGDDCVDDNADINPGVDELCNDIDDDCDTEIDEDEAIDALKWYADTDEDTYGNVDNFTFACEQPEGFVTDDTDCDDEDQREYPGQLWFVDGDTDGYGDRDAVGAECQRANDSDVLDNTDCDDANPDANPGVTEIWYDDVDGDCDGWSDFDQDRDTYDSSADLEGGDDCDDTNPGINPAATEVQDAVDNNCDSLCDEGFISAGDLVITEIMYNPAQVSDGDGEWFEVYNASSNDIALCGGWVIEDNDSDSHTITGGPYTISSSDWFVFGINDDTTTNGGVTVDYEYGTGWFLANGNDEIRLVFDGDDIDEVEYDDTVDNWTSIDLAGQSVQVDPDHYDATDNDDSYNWCATDSTSYGSGDLGTPGDDNETCPVE